MKKSTVFKISIFTFIFFATVLVSFAQNFTSLKQVIDNTGSCRIASITQSGSGLMVAGVNGNANVGCPPGLDNAFKQIMATGHTIVDAQITESGAWVIVYGANGYSGNGLSASLNAKLKELNGAGHTFKCVSINDLDQWVIVTTTTIVCSDSELGSLVADDMSSYGDVISVCLTDDALVVVYDRGYGIYGEVPDALQNALANSSFNPTHITIAGNKWMISDSNGNYSYNM